MTWGVPPSYFWSQKLKTKTSDSQTDTPVQFQLNGDFKKKRKKSQTDYLALHKLHIFNQLYSTGSLLAHICAPLPKILREAIRSLQSALSYLSSSTWIIWGIRDPLITAIYHKNVQDGSPHLGSFSSKSSLGISPTCPGPSPKPLSQSRKVHKLLFSSESYFRV